MFLLPLAYLALIATKIATHQMWRDEIQSWLLASSSPSVPQLIARVRYEQHPPGWYLLLWVISRFTTNPLALKVLLFSLVATMVAVLLRLAPFPRWVRWLLLFGYFPFFEYSTLSRPYIIEFLLAMLAAELLRRRRVGGLFGLTLATLIFIDNAYGSILALGLLTAAWVRAIRPPPGHQAVSPRPIGCVTATTAALEALLYFLGRMPPDYGGPTLRPALLWHLFGTSSGLTALEQPLHALLPLPELQVHFWNTYLVDNLPAAIVVILGMGTPFIVGWVFRKDLAALALWLIGVLGTVAFMDAANQSFSRFAGTIFISLIAAFWICDTRHAGDSMESSVRIALVLAALFQVPGGLASSLIAAGHPFSEAEQTSAVVRRLHGVVVVAPDYAAISIAGYAGRPLYLAQSRRFGTYTIFNRELLCHLRTCTNAELTQEALRAARRFAAHEPTYILLDFPILHRPTSLHFCRAFTGAIREDENYWLYVLDDAPCAPNGSS